MTPAGLAAPGILPPPGGAAARLRGNVRVTLLGNVVYAAGLWLQLVLFARLGGPSALGSYAFALALAQPAMLLSQLQLRSLLASDARYAYSFREYRALRVATSAAALVSMIPLAWASGQWRILWPVLVPVCAQAAADGLADIYCGLWQQHERMAVAAWVLSLNAVASVALVAVAGWAGGGAPAMAAGSALGSCLALLFAHVRTRGDDQLGRHLASGAPLRGRRLVRLAREAAPLGAIVLLGSLQTNVPRYAVQHYGGTASLGMFAAAYQLT
ncbi:MAG TPA: oligosaccharide flippase family protein, partial [Anaeromyxobacter sp.]|nr:oligosaccharide flippase family protein [Anaeromyxobacter sp.]